MPGRILVIDDESQITRVLRAALSAQGYDVRTANEPEEGLRVFRDWAPDLVITDLMMPTMSGVEVCRSIRSRGTTPVLVLSVREHERSKVEALDAAPTTMSLSHSAFRSCWPVSEHICGARRSAPLPHWKRATL